MRLHDFENKIKKNLREAEKGIDTQSMGWSLSDFKKLNKSSSDGEEVKK